MKRIQWIGLLLILVVIGFSTFISLPQTETFLGRDTVLRQGLDLQGGVRLVYQLDLSETGSEDRQEAIESTRRVIERRVNATGVAEPLIQPSRVGTNFAVVVELPGVRDVNEAIDLIGRTAQLEFKELDPASAEGQPNWLPTGLTGKQLRRASVTFEPTTNAPQISLQFDADGQRIFGEVTARNNQRPLAIFLDQEMLSAPTVQETITTGEAVISGQFTIQEVRDTTNLLNAGALDVPISLVEQRTIGATLGEESIKASLIAGAIGLALVALFMLINYGLAGLIAILALIGYTLITYAIFKLVPVTMTLSGIAGFVLSIGMAVDANILIFERMREELRRDKDLRIAMEEGFRRAWPSVRDSNAATLITCGILFFTTTGSVRGFALTLAIGVFVSLFSSITASRSFLRLAAQSAILSRGVEKI